MAAIRPVRWLGTAQWIPKEADGERLLALQPPLIHLMRWNGAVQSLCPANPNQLCTVPAILRGTRCPVQSNGSNQTKSAQALMGQFSSQGFRENRRPRLHLLAVHQN